MNASFDWVSSHMQWQILYEFIRIGTWPATLVLEDCVTSTSPYVHGGGCIYIFIGSPVSLESVPREIEEERVEYGVQVCAYFWNLILVTESLIWYG